MRSDATVTLWVLCCVMSSAHAECDYDLTAFTAGCVPASSLTPRRITNDGWVIGRYLPCGMLGLRGFVWTPSDGFKDLPPPAGYKEADPASVSAEGVIIGSVRKVGNGEHRACLWFDGVPTLMPELPNVGSKAVAIGPDGTVYGYSLGPAQAPQCVAWLDGALVPMPDALTPRSPVSDQFTSGASNGWLCGIQQFGPTGTDLVFRMRGDLVESAFAPRENAGVNAADINRSGVLAGGFSVSTDRDLNWEEAWGFRYDGAVTALPGLTGYSGAQPVAMNDAGVLVGVAYCVEGSCAPLPPSTPVLWRESTVVPVADLLPRFNGSLYNVHDINNRGQMVLSGGYLDLPGGAYAVILAAPKNVPVGDLDVDCVVDVGDLTLLIESWGARDEAPVQEADLDGDGEIGPLDLAQLLGAWSPSR